MFAQDDNAIKVRDCSIFISESMIIECFENEELIRQTCMLEGAKFDWGMKNFLKEGEDYKGLKKELKEIIKANDLAYIPSAASLGKSIATLNPAIIVGSILGFIIGFIINRILRYAWDTAEFNTIKEDAKTIVSDLRRNANKTEDEKLKKKYNDEADRLEEAIKKYSSKNEDKKD